MPALNFKKQFADSISNGRKTQTIRPNRKRPIKTGDKLYLYSGLRTKNSQKIKETVCTSVEPIGIGNNTIIVNNKSLTYSEQALLAHADGFNSVREFKRFFQQTYTLPFNGVIIKWQ